MTLKFRKIILLLSLVAILVLPQIVLASTQALDTLDKVGSGEGPYNPPADNNTPLLDIVGTVISVVLGLIGVVFLALMLYAGYNWMTARGEEEKVTKAKDIIIQSVIGIIIVVGAYAIWAFVFNKLF